MAEPETTLTAHTALHREVRRNQRRTAAMLAVLGAVVLVLVGAVVLLLGLGVVGLAVAVVLALAAVALADASAARAAVAATGARPAEGPDTLRLHNLTEGLCIAAGVPKPRLYVVEDDALNAFTAGRNPKRAVLVVTTGLLRALNRVELEGVLADELSHIRNYDTVTASVGVVALAGPVLLGDTARAARRDPAPRRLAVLALPFTVFSVVAPLVGWALRRVLPASRELDADAAGVRLTRYPPGLAAALTKLRDRGTVVRAATRATAPLWLAAPVDDRSFDTHPPLGERIRVLEGL